jgi:cell division protein FtsX
MKRFNILAISLALLAVFGSSLLVGQIKKPVKQPNSILHVITVKWKAEATSEQKQAALDGVRKMAAEIPGITNVWLVSKKLQFDGFDTQIAMEFKDQAAFDAYADHPSHRAWEKVYLPIRAQSRTCDITN